MLVGPEATETGMHIMVFNLHTLSHASGGTAASWCLMNLHDVDLCDLNLILRFSVKDLLRLFDYWEPGVAAEQNNMTTSNICVIC